jgi:HPr kinase/phosphorylase
MEKHGAKLELEPIGDANVGYERVIREPTVNRPGLALAGFLEHFAHKRVQAIGSAEQSYLRHLTATERNQRFKKLCETHLPCFVFSRNYRVPSAMIELARRAHVPLFRTPLQTRHFINAATISLEDDFAPTVSEYGSLVDINGIGTLIKGASGVGKSECVLGLIERGHSLVSDDITRLRNLEGMVLSGTAMELGRSYMEVRGLGIIDVPAIFGVGSYRQEKRLDLVVTLKDWQELEEVDRIGLDQTYLEILGIKIPHVTIPVRSGRDIARLVEVAALDQRLKSLGRNSAVEFNEKLIKYMQHNARKNQATNAHTRNVSHAVNGGGPRRES